MSGLLSLLTGAADQLDFIPGFDPRKDKRGLISALLGGGQKPIAPMPAPTQPKRNMGDIMQIMSQPPAPGGAAPQGGPPLPGDYSTKLSFFDALNPFKDTMQIRANDQARYNMARSQYTAQQAQAAAAQQRSQRTSDATQYGLSGRDALAFINSGEVPDAKVVNSGDSVFVNGGYQQAPETFTAETDALGRPMAFGNVSGAFRDPVGPAEPFSLTDGAQMRDPITGELIAHNEKNFAPPGNGITVKPDGTIQIGGKPSEYSLDPTAPKGKQSGLVFDDQGMIRLSPNPQQAGFNKAALKFNDLAAKNNLVQDDLQRALDSFTVVNEETGQREVKSGQMAAGPASVFAGIPVFGASTPAGTLEGFITTIKANVGFDELQAMREASPTGGALGQVSEQEIKFLQALLGDLEQARDPEVLAYNLERLKTFLAGRQQRYADAFAADYPEIGAAVERREGAKRTVEDLVNHYAD